MARKLYKTLPQRFKRRLYYLKSGIQYVMKQSNSLHSYCTCLFNNHNNNNNFDFCAVFFKRPEDASQKIKNEQKYLHARKRLEVEGFVEKVNFEKCLLFLGGLHRQGITKFIWGGGGHHAEGSLPKGIYE